ncbi:MAG TPA: MgtC/SapB family protein [Firmicutes bacterium]|nr:MgtC/SapB family protein [Bacillota bacterium]
MRTEFIFVFRLVLAAILGGFIGLERERLGRPAGLRTHTLVSIGSCLIMLISIYGFAGTKLVYDPGRLAAQVVSGIGFLGAGTIIREGLTIRGLTTAASLWLVAGIGLATGAGFWAGAVFSALLAVLTLILLENVEKKFISPRSAIIEVSVRKNGEEIGKISETLRGLGVHIRNIEIDIEDNDDFVHMQIVVDGREFPRDKVLGGLLGLNSIRKVQCR